MKNVRNQRGVSGMVMVLITSFLILLPLGLLGYEFLRYSLVQQELHSVCDAAGLAGAVGIATNGGGSFTLWQQEQEAMASAYNVFCDNMLTDCKFIPVGNGPGANVNEDSSTNKIQPNYFNSTTNWAQTMPPAAHHAKVNFVLLDANKTQTNWDPNQGPNQQPLTSAASLRVDAYYGYTLPVMGSFGIGPFTMVASSTGGLPQLDVILCFDMSGSMDDFTNVTFVNRYWLDTRAPAGPAQLTAGDIAKLTAAGFPGFGGGAGGVICYDVPGASSNYPAQGPGSSAPFLWTNGPQDNIAHGPLYYVLGCNKSSATANGTALNVQPPMNLNNAIYPPTRFYFLAQQRNSNNDNAAPPGNYVSAAPWANTPLIKDSFNIPGFTDLIVNLNGNAHWGPWPAVPVSVGGHTFRDIAWAVEAARGNLENHTRLHDAVNPQETMPAGDNHYYYLIRVNGVSVGAGNFGSISGAGDIGIQSAYWQYVQQNTHPLADAVSAASQFFQFLHNSSDCHFGLICFSDGIGNQTPNTPPTDTWGDAWESPPGGTNINQWTTKENGGSSTPPLAPYYSGAYTSSSCPNPPNSYDPWAGIDTGSPNGSFKLPLVMLNNGVAYNATSANYENYSSNGTNIADATGGGIMNVGNGNVGSGICALGSTNITDALKEAIDELTSSKARPNATKAIVLFTDGAADIDQGALPPNPNYNECKSECIAQAGRAHSASPQIAIYSIGLCLDQTGPMVGLQQQLLQGITDAANGGPSGNSTWVSLGSVSQMQQTFQSIAKNLVVITQDK